MFSTTFNIIPLLFTVLTGFGLVFHDTKVDHATTTALSSMSSSVAAHAVVPMQGVTSDPGAALRSSDHTHAEHIKIVQAIKNVSNLEPRLQTRISEEKKYVAPKKLLFNTSSF